MGDDIMMSVTPGISPLQEVLAALSICRDSNTSFEDLPGEMLLAVFRFLDTKDLIGTCRLVSKRWKKFSSELCRKRFVKLKNWWEKGVRNVDDISLLFDTENLPWSSYSLLTSYSKKHEEEDAFLAVFGKHIWHLYLNEGLCISCNEIKRVLSHTPNLRRLEIETDPDEQDWTTSASTSKGGSGSFNLRKLKRMELSVLNNYTVEFLNFIISDCCARLDYFKSVVEVKSAEAGEMVVSLLRNVPFISFGFRPNSPRAYDFKSLSWTMKKLRITELEFSLLVWGHEISELNNETAEQFIAFHSQHLERLSITIYSKVLSIPFKFPSLPSLSYFFVEFCCDRTGSGLLSLLETNQFPVLSEVYIKDSTWPLSPIRLFFPANCHFDSVSKLTVHSMGCSDKWNQIFPNLTSMKSAVCNRSDSDELVRHFSSRNLEHLYLEICDKLSTAVDLNSLLSGIPNPDAVYQKLEDEIRELRLTDGRPSILQLTKLKTLDIKLLCNGDTDWILRDSGAYLALLPLQPLDLTLNHVQLSQECKEKLKAHHRTFTIDD